MEDRINLEKYKLSNIQSMISLADNKGSLFLIILGAFVAFSGEILSLPKYLLDNSSNMFFTVIVYSLLIAYVLLMLRAFYFTLQIFKADTTGILSENTLIKADNSRYFSKGIRNRTFEKYLIEVKEEKEESTLNQLASQTYINSEILNNKFTKVNKVKKLIIPIVILFGLLIIISSFIDLSIDISKICENITQ